MTSQTLTLAQALISRPSLTPDDAGCQTLIAERLKKLDFSIESMRFETVDNLWARYGSSGPLLVFAGHTDVVPTGPLSEWHSHPFEPTIRDGFLFGRGAADMKSGLAAMVIAAEQFIQKNPDFPGSIAFLITSDEEGPTNTWGTQQVVAELSKRGIKMDYCIIGEASSEKHVGDQIRVGRRGSLNGTLIIHGKQGHVAFPHLASNPIHLAAQAIAELTSTEWDRGNAFFPATTFQISNIQAGTGALNVIPGDLTIHFNFRFSTEVTAEQLKQRVTDLLKKQALTYDIEWRLTGQPFLTQKGKLLTAVQTAIQACTGLTTQLSTGGGTSDGRFIAPTGTEVIELGPCNESVHKINEYVRIDDLASLTTIYEKTLELLFLSHSTG